MDNIDKVATAIGKKSESIRKKIIDVFSRKYAETKDINAALEFITNTSFTDLILNEFGLQKELDKTIPVYEETIKLIKDKLGYIDERLANSLYDIQRGYIYNHVRDVGTELTYTLTKGIIGNFTEKQMAEALTKATTSLADYQINALVNTTVRTFGSTVKAETFNQFGKKWKYRYEGPRDEKTREVCNEVLDMQAKAGGYFTYEELSTLPVNLTDRGGFNCRHDFIKVIDND